MTDTLVPATTPARVRALLSTMSVSSDIDGVLESMIAGATRAIEQYLGTSLALESRVEERDIDPGQTLVWLDAFPVTGVTEIRNDPDWGFASTIAATDYRVESEFGRIAFRFPLTEGRKALQVTYTAGIGATTEDIIDNAEEIATACDLQVAADYRSRNQSKTQSRGGPRGDLVTREHDQLIPKVRQILDRRRRVTV